ncbi:MAG: hypothetical protein EZS28_022404 [Streblomastix strix]|uniref:Uncharacterized protein n=1 Tax=Streblomastix strix TaxID=222440 RepID=A0A5J4VHT8_9EUKA|nr:MAG: hypothetical protein EZS28_022404 [Streblomastix strix]
MIFSVGSENSLVDDGLGLKKGGIINWKSLTDDNDNDNDNILDKEIESDMNSGMAINKYNHLKSKGKGRHHQHIWIK